MGTSALEDYSDVIGLLPRTGFPTKSYSKTSSANNTASKEHKCKTVAKTLRSSDETNCSHLHLEILARLLLHTIVQRRPARLVPRDRHIDQELVVGELP